MARAIGIDLGTTNTVVATIQDGRANVLPNAEGQYLTPSAIAFGQHGELLVGQLAKRQAAVNAARTVLSIKRRMGSAYRIRTGDTEYTPQEVSSFILRKVKGDAEAVLGEKIAQAVITVPAYFNDRQRVATREAGILAGLDVMRIINEPTAAALAYGLEREDAHTILVWDLGGGTFDVSILELGDGIFEVRAVGGDAWLGGDDFDQRVADYLAGVYEKHGGAKAPGDAAAVQTLREAAEAAKVELSSAAVARVRVPLRDLGAPEDLDLFMSRGELEALTADLLHRMAVCTKQVLADAQLTPEQLDRVILVGGATRMPAVRRLAESLTGKRPYRYLDPDLLVALGAATHAGMLLGLIEKAVLLDVLPLSLGVETQGGLVATIIPRNMTLPASEAHIFTTAADYQTSVDIHVLQGERVLAAENVSLGELRLDGIPPAVRGMAKVEVAFEADVDGIIRVSATDLWRDIQVKAKIASTKLLDPTDVEHSTEEAQRSLDQDQQKRERITAAIETKNVIAAAEMALTTRAALNPDPWTRQIAQALSKLKRAEASGVVVNMRTRSRELRNILAPRNKARAIRPRQARLAQMETGGR